VHFSEIVTRSLRPHRLVARGLRLFGEGKKKHLLDEFLCALLRNCHEELKAD
jgi:hypothetical protein